MSPEEADRHWLAVIGRALAFSCLTQADLRDKGLVPQARLLPLMASKGVDVSRILDWIDGGARP
jgi:hypothetical protein